MNVVVRLNSFLPVTTFCWIYFYFNSSETETERVATQLSIQTSLILSKLNHDLLKVPFFKKKKNQGLDPKGGGVMRDSTRDLHFMRHEQIPQSIILIL